MADVARAARLTLLRGLLEQACYGSQQELSAALAADDVHVSQSTLSKDLVTLGAIRRRAADGGLVYALDQGDDHHGAAREKLARLCAELLQSLQVAGNQLVLRTPPGAAQFFAAALDAARVRGVMGTIAGDDTVLVISTDDRSAGRVISELSEMTRSGRPTQEDE